MADTRSTRGYQRKPGDAVVRPMRRRTERIVTGAPRTPRRPPPPALLLAVSFLLAVTIGAGLLALPVSSASGAWTSPRIALFTATSAVSLTGLVLVDTGTHWSLAGQVVILVLIQLGGLGFMTGASLIFLLLGRRLSLEERLLMHEAVRSFGIGGAVWLVKRIAIMMLVFEALGTIILLTQFMPDYPLDTAVWFALFHAVSAFNNAGFDVIGNFRSMSGYHADPVVLVTMTALFVLGGMSFLTLSDIATRRSWTRLSLDTKLVIATCAGLWGVAFLAILVAEWNNVRTLGGLSIPQKLLNALFQTVSAGTAGFSTLHVGELSEQTQLLSVALMFVGGASASTAGGIRLNTFSVLLVAIIAAILGRADVHVFRRSIPSELVNRALAIALLSIALLFAVAYLLAVTEDRPFLALLFEAASAFGNNGMTTGITPQLSPLSSLIVTVTMLVGRLGPLTLAVLLAGQMRTARIRYAQETVRVG